MKKFVKLQSQSRFLWISDIMITSPKNSTGDSITELFQGMVKHNKLM